MADNAGKLDKLSRLKSLRSGLKAKGGPVAEEDALSIDTLFAGGVGSGEEDAAPARPPARKKPASETPAPPATAKDDEEGESLSAYFEALGIVPGGAKKADATGTAPKPYAPPSSAYTKPDGKGVGDTRGRDVDIRDRWADPVREDESYLSSFAGTPPAPDGETPPPVDLPPVAEKAPPAPPVEEAQEPPADIAPPTKADDPKPEASATVPDVPGAEDGEKTTVAPDAEASELDLPDDLLDDLPEDLRPDFDKTIDIEAFEREIAMADPAHQDGGKAAAQEPASGEPLTVTFDPDRAATLEQVSKQMGCSIDDVVVTAVDWYLDALLEDDGSQADSAGS